MKQATVKELMKAALKRLLTKKKVIDITVTDLVREASIARASFYRVYSNIDQIIDDVVLDLRENFRTGMLQALIKKDKEEIRARTLNFFYAINDNNNLLFKLLPENISIIIGKIEHLGVFNKNEIKDDSMESKYIPGLVFVNIMMIVKIWESRGFKESPEELTDFTYELIAKKYLAL